MSDRFDLTTLKGRLGAYLDLLWGDHAYLRLGFQNAHWIDRGLVRSNQPWPFQLKWWREKGVRTVINLRGGGHKAGFYALERDACARLGLAMVDFPVNSREAPSRAQVEGLKHLFETVEYPVLMHCKSGADRAGVASVLYAHFRLGLPIREAVRRELNLRHLHMRQGKTGVIDYSFDLYLAEAEPKGISYLDWVRSDAYDPRKIKADFHASWWGTLVTEKLLRRE